MNRVYETILKTIGDTPVLWINPLAPPRVDLFVKIEAFDPLGSVTDPPFVRRPNDRDVR